MAQTLAEVQFSLLFHPERVNRLIHQKAFDATQLGFTDLLDAVQAEIFDQTYETPAEIKIQQLLQNKVVNQLIDMYLNKEVYPQVSAHSNAFLERISKAGNAREATIFASYLGRKIDQFFANPMTFKPNRTPQIPDGSPIGSYQCNSIN